MSIEQKIAELLAENKKESVTGLEEDRVKPNGTEGGSDSATKNAVAAEKSGASKKGTNAVEPSTFEENPDNARNNVQSQDGIANDIESKPANPANCKAVEGDPDAVRKGNAVKGMKEDMDALFSGEELSEEFQAKATTIFESAVMVRVNAEVARIEEEFAGKLEEDTAEQIEGLLEQVDGYLGYIAEQWITQNELALENGIKSEIVESFVNGIKNVFEDHYVDIPNEKYDVLGEMNDAISSLEEKLNEQVAKNVELSNQVNNSIRSSIVTEAADGLSDVETEKFSALVEELAFDNIESFTTKVKTLRESYFNNTTATDIDSIVNDSPVDNLNEETKKKVIDPKMAQYLSAWKN